ncbi:putative carbohydrate binding domain containing protein [uncultured Mediterranean phage uvMED]|nr:putative carbohydrate binding domain containing protein [uncultured Mediterranean phage uvMED]
MATINLGAIKFNWKGAYNNSTAYAVDDVVSSGGSSYVCILASQGNAVTNGTYWSVMAQAGTNGTDVGTTLTTQGDILYRDGSGLARLGYGTSGQVLQTGGSGANPSWTTLSSDMVKLASTEATGVSAVNFDNIFTTDYHNYYFIGSALSNSANHRCDFNPRQSTTNILANRHETATYNYRQYSGGSANNLSVDANMNDTNGGRLGWGRTDTEMNFTVLLSNPLGTSNYKVHKYECSSMDGTYVYLRQGSTIWRTNTNAFTGFRFFNPDGGNTDFKITVFGIRK